MEGYVIRRIQDGAFFCTRRPYNGYTKSPRIYAKKGAAGSAKTLMSDVWLKYGFLSREDWFQQLKELGVEYNYDNRYNYRSFIEALAENAKEEPYWGVVPLSEV